jgi:AcrR family transcriptional regulator
MSIKLPAKSPPKSPAKPALANAAKPSPSLSLSLPDIFAVRAEAQKPMGARERILFAAVEILNAEGFGGLTQTRVAERAGIRQSHLTYYFPARNDLLRETAVFGCEAMLGALEMGIESGELNIENFREVMAVDIHDRRFARLMCALIVASDEDAEIKPWLANFEAANMAKIRGSFHKLGLPVTIDEVAFFHATYVGSVMLDLGESTDDSLERAQRHVTTAFDVIANAARERVNIRAAISSNQKAKTCPKSTPALKVRKAAKANNDSRVKTRIAPKGKKK